METVQGIAVSPGLAIGEALVIFNEGVALPRRSVLRDTIDAEFTRLRQAIEAATGEISANRDAVADQLGEKYGGIFSAHLQMLQDPKLQDEFAAAIRDDQCSAETAVSRTLRRYAQVFENSENAYMAERAHDLFDLEKSLLRHLTGSRHLDLSTVEEPYIILAHDLTPSETARLNPEYARAFVTEIGGASGHTAIVARGLEIPAIVGAGRFLNRVSNGDAVIVDGDQGKMILRPDQQTVDQYKAEAERRRLFAEKLESLRDLPAATRDGVRIELTANIEFPHEASLCLERGADGIGLYRTEFLYLSRETDPTEEDHYEAYAEVAHTMGDRPVVLRTLDLGADKMGLMPPDEEERNPFLGLRSIRLALRNLQLFRPQLRAVLRASVLGNLKIMFPLITTVSELRDAKRELLGAMTELEQQGIPFNREIEIGMMVESPAAVVLIDRFVKEVDFISIGTNDLVQYALAVDRTNASVADLYQAADPAVLRLIQQAIDAARSASVDVSMCGQMAGDPVYTALLLGLGLRELSVPPSAVPVIKQICRELTIPQCETIARQALEIETAAAVDEFLGDELSKIGRS